MDSREILDEASGIAGALRGDAERDQDLPDLPGRTIVAMASLYSVPLESRRA